MTNVVTYHSANAKPHQAWLAYIVLSDGNQLNIRFESDTEDKAKERALAWYASEKERQARIMGTSAPVEKPTDGWSSAPMKGIGKGQGFVGTAWMLNRATGHRVRCAATEVAAYAAKGYVKGGPRSK